MGKYIIELPDDEHLISWWTYIGTEDGKQHIDFHEVVKTPYKEPDLEATKQEVYQRGLAEAWDAARKIASIPTAELHTMFDKEVYYDTVFRDCTAPEALSKLAAYEEQKEHEDAEFRVGDEFITKNNKDLGVIVGADAKGVLVLWKDDSDIFYENNREFTTKWAKERFAKTGRHFPEIAEVFKKMQEETA